MKRERALEAATWRKGPPPPSTLRQTVGFWDSLGHGRSHAFPPAVSWVLILGWHILAWNAPDATTRPEPLGDSDQAYLQAGQHSTEEEAPSPERPGREWVLKQALETRCALRGGGDSSVEDLCLYIHLSWSGPEDRRRVPFYVADTGKEVFFLVHCKGMRETKLGLWQSILSESLRWSLILLFPKIEFLITYVKNKKKGLYCFL